MDTLSSSVSTLKVPAFNPILKPHEIHHFKSHRPKTYHNQLSNTKPTSTFSRNPNYQFPHKIPNPKSHSTSFHSPTPKSQPIHRNPATGYAAALIDVGQRKNSLHSIQENVQKLSRLLKTEEMKALFVDPFVEERVKGEIVKSLAKTNKMNSLVMGLLKILSEKKRIGILGEVCEEFERVYDELIGTKVVFVSSGMKMEENELFQIAEKVQKISGGVKVKVKNLVVGEGLSDPGFLFGFR